MIFRQLHDPESCTYTYVLASDRGREAMIIDPVLGQVDQYLRLFEELDLRLVKAVDTHLHADHVTALGKLRDVTRCVTVMGEQSKADVVGLRLCEGDQLGVDGLSLDVVYTPGHTNDSHSFVMTDRVFTGDTLLIGGTGRCDFQNGDAEAQYDSLFNKLLRLPEDTKVYPAHDYRGNTVSTIGEERAHNPRLQVDSVQEYVDLMNDLKLPNPRLMDVAVPANRRIGLAQDRLAEQGRAVAPHRLGEYLSEPGAVLVDLREDIELTRSGEILGSRHVPYHRIESALQPGQPLHQLAADPAHRLLFVCSYGECSAMAVELAHRLGLANCQFLLGGITAYPEDWDDLLTTGVT